MKKKTTEKTHKGVTYHLVKAAAKRLCVGCAFNGEECTCPARFPACATPGDRPDFIWKRVTPELVDYTVILLYPDFLADDYPQFFSAVVAARNPVDAVAAARKRVAFLNKEGLDEDADLVYLFMVVSVHRGAHKELNPEA